MNGVILFADDHIFEKGRLENDLFNRFNTEMGISVLPINNLENLENTISYISNYKALILDWNFTKTSSEEFEGVQIPDDNPYEILKKNKIFSVVYIYSQADISPETKQELQEMYPGKIFFETKGSAIDHEAEYQKIMTSIHTFDTENTHMTVPYVWSKAINQAAQTIFSEFEKADKYWIKELYYSAVRLPNKETGEPIEIEVDPTIEVITLFQNILSERLIQNVDLTKAIEKYAIENFKSTTTDSSTLYSKLYYTKTLGTDTVMTGDVYKLKDDCFGIIISPECDMATLIQSDDLVELLCFSKNSFDIIRSFLPKVKDARIPEEIERAYNQEIPRIHLLPIFPFSTSIKKTALIDFRHSLKLVKGKYLLSNRNNRQIKINSPYIQQLRQRYLAYIGRVGVPAIPYSLRFTS